MKEKMKDKIWTWIIVMVMMLYLMFASIYFAEAQTVYGGIIIDENSNYMTTNIRPYINGRVDEKRLWNGLMYSPIIGAGINSVGNLSLAIGYDLGIGIKTSAPLNFLWGFSIEYFGMNEVYQDFMPNMRIGLESNRFIFVATNNWKYVNVNTPIGIAVEPKIRPTIGIFYKLVK